MKEILKAQFYMSVSDPVGEFSNFLNDPVSIPKSNCTQLTKASCHTGKESANIGKFDMNPGPWNQRQAPKLLGYHSIDFWKETLLEIDHLAITFSRRQNVEKDFAWLCFYCFNASKLLLLLT